MNPLRGGGVGVALLALVTGVAAGALAVLAMGDVSSPPSLAPAPTVTSLPVTAQPYVDPRSVDVEVTAGPALTLRPARAGLLTDVDCAIGGRWTSGTRSVSVDGQGLLNLHSRHPLWRELFVGDRGADVRGLKKELARLGLPTDDGNVLQPSDLRALQRLADSAGAHRRPASISPEDVIWLPRPTITLGSCDAATGETVQADSVLASAPGDVAVRILTPEPLVEGERVLRLDGLDLPLDAELALRAEADRARVADSSDYRSAMAESAGADGPVVFSASVELTEPIEVVAVIPSAIQVTSMSTGCVASDRGVENVTIVTSDLGRSLVMFDDGSLPASIAAKAPASCP